MRKPFYHSVVIVGKSIRPAVGGHKNSPCPVLPVAPLKPLPTTIGTSVPHPFILPKMPVTGPCVGIDHPSIHPWVGTCCTHPAMSGRWSIYSWIPSRIPLRGRPTWPPDDRRPPTSIPDPKALPFTMGPWPLCPRSRNYSFC